jgi:hypothetical protein
MSVRVLALGLGVGPPPATPPSLEMSLGRQAGVADGTAVRCRRRRRVRVVLAVGSQRANSAQVLVRR